MILMFQQVVNIMLHVGMGMGMIDRVDMQRRDGFFLTIYLLHGSIYQPITMVMSDVSLTQT
jgi:hypothetical protein